MEITFHFLTLLVGCILLATPVAIYVFGWWALPFMALLFYLAIRFSCWVLDLQQSLTQKPTNNAR